MNLDNVPFEKMGIDLQIAFELQLPLEQVRAITTEFLEQLMQAVAVHGDVYLRGFGVIRAHRCEGPTPALDGSNTTTLRPKYALRIKKGRRLHQLLHEARGLLDGNGSTARKSERVEQPVTKGQRDGANMLG